MKACLELKIIYFWLFNVLCGSSPIGGLVWCYAQHIRIVQQEIVIQKQDVITLIPMISKYTDYMKRLILQPTCCSTLPPSQIQL